MPQSKPILLRIRELAELLAAAEFESAKYEQIQRTIWICAGCDERWWRNVAAEKSAEELVAYCNPVPPRRLPSLPYEEWPR